MVEQGAATYYGPYWRYVATAAAPAAPEALDIEVTATDLPGHVATATVALMT